jgi:hypothetical protein
MSQDRADNQRRAVRKRVDFKAIVTDVISGQPMGQLGNLSSSGMLLIGPQAPRSEALYQVSLALPEAPGAAPTAPIELGIQEQWHEQAASPGQVWSGFRIIAVSDPDAARLNSWLTQT